VRFEPPFGGSDGTLTVILCFYCRINQYEAENSMTIQNLAIVFGPTLFGMPMSNGSTGQMNGGMADTAHQNKVSVARLV